MQLFIYLGGHWGQKERARVVREGDHVFVGAGSVAPEGFSNIHTEEELTQFCSRQLSDATSAEFDKMLDHFAKESLEPFLNDYYSYTLRKICATLLSIKKCILANDYCKIFIVAPATSCVVAPMIGFQTSESRRGSKFLLAAYTASIIPAVFSEIEFSIITLKGDLFCNDFFRRNIIKLANRFFSILLAIKVAILHGTFAGKREYGTTECLVLIRSMHQARFASRLMEQMKNTAAVVFPQASQGSFASLRECVSVVPSHILPAGLSAYQVLRAYADTRRDVKAMNRSRSQFGMASIDIDGLLIPFNAGWLLDEIELVTVTVFYKNLLVRLLRKVAPDKLINFELVGRMAGIEGAAARAAGVRVHSIQTALVSSTPHPIFPLSDYFYADGIITKNLIQSNGSVRKGEVVYAGPPFVTKPMRQPSFFSRVAYFTQPYEPVITIEILTAICAWARHNKSRVIVKLHPRDRSKYYESIIINNNDVLEFCENTNVEELIHKVDLVVTRTSSVAKEAIGLGCPIILCRWSNFDRAIVADYIVADLASEYSSENELELAVLLGNPEKAVVCSQAISLRLFGSKTLTDLIRTISL